MKLLTRTEIDMEQAIRILSTQFAAEIDREILNRIRRDNYYNDGF